MDGRDTQGRTHDKGNEKENGRADAAAGWARNRRGRIGTHLLKARHDLTVIAICPFVQDYVAGHPEYQSFVTTSVA